MHVYGCALSAKAWPDFYRGWPKGRAKKKRTGKPVEFVESFPVFPFEPEAVPFCRRNRKMDEKVILESLSMRQQLCTEGNTAVLDRVGRLVFLAGTEYSTAQQIADFYRVDLNTLQQVIKRSRTELSGDGYKVLSKSELENVHNVHFEIPNRGLAIFPRRAVLRLGMLLRDSAIAKLVRSYLLNAEESIALSPATRGTLQRMVAQLDRQAEQLIENAHQLSRHAGQLTEHAEELKGHAEQLHSQTRMIKAIVDEIYLNRSEIQEMRKEVSANRKRILALEKLAEEGREKEIEYLTPEQIKILQSRVQEKGKPATVWARLKLHFGVTRYIFLPKDSFREILDWLEKYRPA